MDTQGELRVLIHLSRLNMPSPQTLNMKLPKIRIHLEQPAYYPGDMLRGCFILSASRTLTPLALELTIEGATRSSTSDATGECVLVGSEVSLLNKFSLHKVKKGTFKLYPFETALPLTLPHSYDSGEKNLQPYSIGDNATKYRVIVRTGMHGSTRQFTFADFRVLAHPMHATLVPPLLTLNFKPAPAIVDVDGPPVAWCGELSSLKVNIQNDGNSHISHLVVRLKVANWTNGCTLATSWRRNGGKWKQETDVTILNLPGFPIEPGQAWRGVVEFPIQANLNPTMHATVSPLLQTHYHFNIKPVASDGKFLKASGRKRHPINILDHYAAYSHLKAPSKVKGAVGPVTVAPAPSNLISQLAPLPQTTPGVLKYCGGSFGSVAAYPDSSKPRRIPHLHIFHTLAVPKYWLTDAEWTPGAEPSWFPPPQTAPTKNE